MGDVAGTATNAYVRSDFDVRPRWNAGSAERHGRSLVDRVQSEDDCFSSVEKTTGTIDEASQLRATRRSDAARWLMQLEELFQDDYGTSLAQASRNDANNFLALNFTLPPPVLSAEEDGTVLATWKRASQSLVIRFKGSSTIDFAVAYMKGHKLTRTWGPASIIGFFTDHPEAKKVALITD